MQVRAVLLAFALFGAGCSSVSEPAAALAAALAAAPLPPLPQFVLQPVWERWPGRGTIDEFYELWHLGDVDGDGFEDLAGEGSRGPFKRDSRAWLISGRDGTLLAEPLDANRSQDPESRTLGSWHAPVGDVVNVGDVDGDGVSDVAMGICGEVLLGRDEPTGVWLFSSKSWRNLRIWLRPVDSFGKCLAPVGDVDGDGRSDFAVTNDHGPASVEVLSMSGDASSWLTELPTQYGFLRDLIAIGDADGDGLRELAVHVRSGFTGPSTLFVLAGRDGSILWSRSGALPGEWEHLSIASAGDVDVDGVPDLWAVIYEPDLDSTRVELLSGRDGTTLRSADRSRFSAGDIKACADLDGDCVSELVVPWCGRGEERGRASMEVISSRTLTPLCSSTLADGDCVAALRTPYGVRIVTNGQSGLQAFDLVRVEAGR